MQEKTKRELTADSNAKEIDEIIAELDQQYIGKLPERALRAAQQRRAEITPRLIELIGRATENVRAGNESPGEGHFFAFFLLAEFQAREALPAVLEAISLPGEGPLELFGDAIYDDLCRMLAAWTADTPEIVEELIANRSLNIFVRWGAAHTYLHWVRDGRLTRDEAVERLRSHLRQAIADKDAEVAAGLICELIAYSPHEALADIEEAYRLDLVDSFMVELEDVQRSIREGESRFQKELSRCRPTEIQDTVAELSRWAAFQPAEAFPADSVTGAPPSIWPAFQPQENPSSGPRSAPASSSTKFDDKTDADGDDENAQEPVTTIRNTAPKVGRNDPCPCGSGKKYKKCCGAG